MTCRWFDSAPAAAIGFGGPGTVFWMWLVAFLGAYTAYVESILGQIYKEVDEATAAGIRLRSPGDSGPGIDARASSEAGSAWSC